MTRIVIFLAALVLVAAHLTGNMNALNTWIDFKSPYLLFILILPFVFVAAIVLLRDESR